MVPRAAGGDGSLTAVAYGVDDALDILRQWGAVRPAPRQLGSSNSTTKQLFRDQLER
jgi:hypothetical protein